MNKYQFIRASVEAHALLKAKAKKEGRTLLGLLDKLAGVKKKK